MHFLDTFFFGTTLGVRGQGSGFRGYRILLTALSELSELSDLSDLPSLYCNNKQ